MKTMLAGLAVAFALTGCASIVSGTHKNITINSTPPGATATIYNKRGALVRAMSTPCVVSLRRGDGYWVPARYKVNVEKEGYNPQTFEIGPATNFWVLGNLPFGWIGLAGLLFFEPSTGAMYMLSPAEINASLVPDDSVKIKSKS
ncbi:MAG: PEGA domain-containing protein [Verrucomicrobiae bacterium]